MTPLRPLLCALCVLCVSPLSAQVQPPTEEPKKDQPPAEKPAEAPKPDQPSLDDLLGLPSAKPKGKPRPEPADPSAKELDRKLSAREVAEQFKQAVELMGETAERIQVSRDTGLTTQRLQEDILRKLDALIKAAEQNKRQSSSSQRQQQQQDQQQPQPSQAQAQRNPDGTNPAPDTLPAPPGSQANPAPGTAARGALWGNLPARMRDALIQSGNDKLSERYRKTTEAYYRRLAEEANR